MKPFLNTALLGLLLLSLQATAFVVPLDSQGRPLRWSLLNPDPSVSVNVVNRQTQAVRYYLASDAFSENNRTAELNAVHASFDQWQTIPGSHLKFEFAGLVPPGVDINTSDNTNVVFWVKGTTLVNGGKDNIAGTLGVAFFSWFQTQVLKESDIVLNGSFNWFTDFEDVTNMGQFVESVLMHEIGHSVGLEHSPLPTATLFARGRSGIGAQTGLSHDEQHAAQWLYPSNPKLPSGNINGIVTREGQPVLGALITAQDEFGNLRSGTLTRTNGTYQLPALPPGTYQLRVSPISPNNSPAFLVRGFDISFNGTYDTAETNFLPTESAPLQVTANGNYVQNFAVTAGTPLATITRLRPPTNNPNILTIVNSGIWTYANQQTITLGIYSPQLFSTDQISITGDGITVLNNQFDREPFFIGGQGQSLLSLTIQVAANATPGLRSFILKRGDQNIAFAEGAFKIVPVEIDNNYDGLDDRFQRRYFSPFTAAEAKPDQNPDGDALTNYQEYLAGSNPTDPDSVLAIDQVRLTPQGAFIRWPSAANRKYQLQTRDTVINSPWQTIGTTITATGTSTEAQDPTAKELRFYRVLAIP